MTVTSDCAYLMNASKKEIYSVPRDIGFRGAIAVAWNMFTKYGWSVVDDISLIKDTTNVNINEYLADGYQMK